MADLPTRARVAIIGGGAVGASCLYHLAQRGWSDCVLLEKNELTSGSTWHAAGNCPTFSASWGVMNIQRYSTELYRRLGDEVDYPMNYHVTGSIRLAHSRNRMLEFERVVGMGRHQGMDMRLMRPEEMREIYPFLELHDLAGGLYDPYDGDIDPAQLTQALAKGARDMGALIVRFCPVTGARRDGADWVLETPKGALRAEYVVNAAGYRAQEIGRMLGREIPLVSMSHQYLLTEPIPELEARADQGKLPLLRDVDSSYYLRQEKFGFNLGPYERTCRAHWISADDPMPEDFSFQLYPDDLDRLEWYIDDAIKRVPILGSVGVNKVINGPIPYAPDGHPLIGPTPGVENAFEACVFTFGIAQAGGAGKVLAEWVVDGGPDQDMWAVDPRRYGPWADQDYAIQKGIEVYGHEYAMHFPHHEWPAGRDKRLSPCHDKIVALGGQMGAYGGWERANWFAKPGDDVSEAATETWERAGPWEPRVREECRTVRDHVGVLDLPGFSRFELSGAGAAEWLRSRIAGALPRVGRMGLAYFPDHRGRILTEMTLLRRAEDAFTLITAAAAQLHDFEWLRRALPGDGALRLVDRTEEVSTLIVTGPASRALFEKIAPRADLSAPWLSLSGPVAVADAPAELARVSFAGELGWEIHAERARMAEIYDAVVAAGATPFGMYALNALRLEKGYRAWKGDLSTDYSLLEAGLERFVRLDGPDFIGKTALLNEKQQGARRSFATLTVEANGFDAPYMASVYKEDEIVGEVTSGGWGYRVERSIALSMLRADCAAPGQRLEIDIYGERRSAEVAPHAALWDPRNERLRA